MNRITVDDRLNAFCKDSDAYLQGAESGPLSGLTFAAKDIFDVGGHVTGGGNPDWKRTHEAAERTAWTVQVLVEAGATMVGKTVTDELTRGILGENPHYGTPVNPRAPGRVPGGSSSGSAAAVAGGLVDFALGSDTGGSVRVPASFCGVYGLRPTHGRVSVEGMLPQALRFDTVGWFARDAETFARVGAVLLQTEIHEARPRRLVVAEDAFELADEAVAEVLRPVARKVASLIGDSATGRLAPEGLAEWSRYQRVLQGREAWETARDWIVRVNPRFSFSVARAYVTGSGTSDGDLEVAKGRRKEVSERIDAVLADGAVVCMPTAPTPAPPTGGRLSEPWPYIARLTCIAGMAGAPQISLPLAEVDGLPVGLSLLGARGSDEVLIAFALEVASSIGVRNHGAL